MPVWGCASPQGITARGTGRGCREGVRCGETVWHLSPQRCGCIFCYSWPENSCSGPVCWIHTPCALFLGSLTCLPLFLVPPGACWAGGGAGFSKGSLGTASWTPFTLAQPASQRSLYGGLVGTGRQVAQVCNAFRSSKLLWDFYGPPFSPTVLISGRTRDGSFSGTHTNSSSSYSILTLDKISTFLQLRKFSVYFLFKIFFPCGRRIWQGIHSSKPISYSDT